MDQNALGQSDCRIFKSTISLERNEKSPIFCMLIQIHENLKLIEKYWGVLGQKWVMPFCSQDSKTD